MATTATDTTATDKAATDQAAADKATSDQAAADKAVADKTAADKAASDKAAADNTAADAAAAGKKPEGGEAAKDGDKTGTEGAPDKYALTPPKDGLIDASDLTTIEKIAREHNLSNEAAQTLLEQENARRIEQSQTLAAQLTADAEYGGDKLPETQRLARSIIDLVRPEGHPRRAAFQRILDQSGYGNHIEIASFLADLGKKAADDTTVLGGGGGGRDKPIANRMYPNMK